jgi:hypothetical protein
MNKVFTSSRPDLTSQLDIKRTTIILRDPSMMMITMNKTIFTLILFVSCSMLASAQAPSYDWVTGAVVEGASAHVRKMSAGPDGTVVIAGSFGNTLHCGSTTLVSSTPPNTNIFVAKLDAQGEFLWARKFGHAGSHRCNDVVVDPQGFIYLTGMYHDSIRFDEHLVLTNRQRGFYLAKLDPDGMAVWAEGSGGVGSYSIHEEGLALGVDASGNVYLGGSFAIDTLTFQNIAIPRRLGPNGAGISNGFVIKLNALGEALWGVGEEPGTNPGFNQVIRLEPDGSGGVFVGGIFGAQSVVLGADTLFNTDCEDAYVGRIDATGQYLWAKQVWALPGTGCTYERMHGLAWNGSHLFLAGHYMGQMVVLDNDAVVLPNNNTPSQLTNIFLFKVDGDGQTIWGRAYGVPDCRESVESMRLTPQGDLLLNGLFKKTFQMDDHTLVNTTGCTWDEGFLAAIDTSGTTLWVKSAGGTNQHDAFRDAIAVEDKVYATGVFTSSPALFDQFSLTGHTTYSNTFVCRLSMPISTGIDHHVPTAVLLHPNPAFDRVRVETSSPVISCEAVDVAGRRTELAVHGEWIGVEQLSSGPYLMLLRTSDGSIIRSRLQKL